MGEYTDIDLLTDFVAGKSNAFREIYDRYYEKLYFISFRILRNKQEAQDIVLITLNKLFVRHAAFESLLQVNKFLYLSARNGCINAIRNRQRLARRHLLSIDPDVQAVTDELDAEFLAKLRQEQQVLELVKQLPQRSREVIIMYYLEQMKYNDIAAMLNISPRSVENILRFALQKLRNALLNKRLTAILLLGALIGPRLATFYRHILPFMS